MKRRTSTTNVRAWLSKVYRHARTAKGMIYRDENYSVRMSYQGRRERFQLGLSNRQDAASRAAEIYDHLLREGWEATLAEFKPGRSIGLRKISSVNHSPTIGQFLAELRELHASKATTIEAYASSLRTIASSIAGLPSGGRGGSAEVHQQWREKVEALPLAILSPANVQKWRESFLVSRGVDPAAKRRAITSVNTLLREARTLFSDRYVESLGESLVLPSPRPFTGIKMEKRVSSRYQSTIDAVALMTAAFSDFDNDPEALKVVLLAFVGGLRRNEIDKLEWRHFDWSAGAIHVFPTPHLQLKSESSIRTI